MIDISVVGLHNSKYVICMCYLREALSLLCSKGVLNKTLEVADTSPKRPWSSPFQRIRRRTRVIYTLTCENGAFQIWTRAHIHDFYWTIIEGVNKAVRRWRVGYWNRTAIKLDATFILEIPLLHGRHFASTSFHWVTRPPLLPYKDWSGSTCFWVSRILTSVFFTFVAFDVHFAHIAVLSVMSRLGAFGLGSYYGGLSDALLQQGNQAQRRDRSDYSDRDRRVRDYDSRRSTTDVLGRRDDYRLSRDISPRRNASRSDRFSPNVSLFLFSSGLSDKWLYVTFNVRFLAVYGR